jgi:hypothetical protein
MREVIESSPVIAQVMNQVPEAQYLHSEVMCFEALGNLKRDLAVACEKIKLARAIILASFPDETAPHFKYEVIEMQLAMSLNNSKTPTLNEVYKYRHRLEEIKDHLKQLKFRNNTLVNLVQRLEPDYLAELNLEISVAEMAVTMQLKILERKQTIKTVGLCAVSAVAAFATVFFIMKKR